MLKVIGHSGVFSVWNTRKEAEADMENILQAEPELSSPGDKVTLLPLAMRVPNKQKIYSPHPFEEKLVISYAQFVALYADSPYTIKVSFDENPNSATIHQNAKALTAYGLGFGYWYIVCPDEA